MDEDAKAVAIAICRAIDEDEAHIASTQFDKLIGMGGRAVALGDEGQFDIPSEALTYASLVVTFVGGIFADAAKDLLKEQLKNLLKRWISGPSLDPVEKSRLRSELDTLVDKAKASSAQRQKLKEAFSAALG